MDPDTPLPEITKRMGDATARGIAGSASLPGGDAEAKGAGMETAGDFIGSYKLIEPLGEGGFGTVWRAEQQEPIHREVALKVIKLGMDSREILARFEAERQALAMMEHPNIAGVLDAGTSQKGRPYFVMELVKGVPITEYADAKKLTIRERLELFIPVCHAVQHAHQKAILHRDLKPSNILITEVDGKATPKVIDFGIAKALGTSPEAALRESLHLTQTGAFVGTPRYMSPEQAGAKPDLDTRSDIYTLGVILFELLTGDTPLSAQTLRSAALDEMLRMIRESEPPRPSSRVATATEIVRKSATTRGTEPAKLTRTLRGDLDWITLRALEKDRERRYGSAAALAADIARHLHSEPVEAGPPSAAYRLRKFIRRNKVALAAAASIFAALVGGLTASIISYRSEKAARSDALRARDSAEKLVNDVLFDLRDKLRPLGRVPLLRKMAESTKAYLDALPERDRTPAREKQRATMLMQLGDVFELMGDTSSAGTSFEGAHGILRRLLGTEPASRQHREDYAVVLERVGRNAQTKADFSGALRLFEEANAIWRKLNAEKPGDLRFQRALPVSLVMTGDNLVKQGRLDEGVKLIEEAVKMERAIGALDGRPADCGAGFSVTLGNLADALSKLHRNEEAEALTREAIGLLSAHLGAHPENLLLIRNLGVQWLRLGEIQMALRKPAEARHSFTRGMSMAEAQIKVDPKTAQWKMDYATAQHHLASVSQHEGNLAAAIGSQDRSAETFQELADEDRSNVEWQRNAALGWVLLAEIQAVASDHAAAEVSWRKALAASRRLQDAGSMNAADTTRLVVILEGVGVSLSMQGRLDDSDASFREAVQVNEGLLKASPADKVSLRNRMILNLHLAENQSSRLNYPAAEKAYREALATAEALLQGGDGSDGTKWDIHTFYRGMDAVLTAQERKPQAESYILKDLALCRERLAAEPGSRRWALALGEALLGLHEAHAETAKPADAEKDVREAVAILGEAVRREPSDAAARMGLQQGWTALAGLLIKQGKHTEAEDAHRKSVSILRDLLRAAPGDVMLQLSLVIALSEQSDAAAARGHEGLATAREAIKEAAEIFFRLKKNGALTPDMLKGEEDLIKALKGLGLPPPDG